jgi:hypothetical protein
MTKIVFRSKGRFRMLCILGNQGQALFPVTHWFAFEERSLATRRKV